ncbi:CACNA1B, partial [Symbiodinium sp. KB8]
VLSLLLVAKPEQRAMAETEIYYQEQRQPPEPESLPVDPPKYGSKVASRQESLDAAVLEAPAAVVEDMNLDAIEMPHSRQ